MNKKMGGRFIDPITKNFPRITAAFCVDAISIWVGALLGIAPLTVYIESATGIREGGRTGITAITTSLFFAGAMVRRWRGHMRQALACHVCEVLYVTWKWKWVCCPIAGALAMP